MSGHPTTSTPRAPGSGDPAHSVTQEHTATHERTALRSSMKPRHLVMMSLGSAIGTGLFVGSGQVVQTAGPAALVAYVIAGFIVVCVMRMLAEMVAADPNPGAFSYYAGKALGPAAAFAVGWLWWLQMCLVVAAEAVAAAQILHELTPAVPSWLYALAVMLAFTGINLVSVGGFGEFEYWFSLVKVAFVVVFLVVAAGFLVGLTPGESPGLSHLTDGSFMPTGVTGVAAALLIVAFSFGGVEIVAIAAAETARPRHSIASATRAILWRILIFYMGSVAVMVLTVRWDDPDLHAAPFVTVLQVAGLPALAATLGVVIVVALLSSLNANLYGGSRMVFSLADRGHMGRGPIGRAFSGTNSRAVPVVAVLGTSVFGFAAVAANFFFGAAVLGFLLNLVGSTLIVTWLVTIVSHLVLRQRARREGTPLPLRMWAFPVLTWVVLALVLAIVALGMTVPAVRSQLIATALLTAVLFGLGWLATRRGTTAP
ncbi:amino acid permease [Brevibacterium litoralis]|uniref:amino acid permease n=1 Tax=Brevibacterium litoralis TaxID=3138935 RepID=UPI0032F078D7